MITLAQRISKLWVAAFNLESAARQAVQYLPPDAKADLMKDLDRFRGAVSKIRREDNIE